MSIKVIQTCDNCGLKRDLPMAPRQSRTPVPDSGGWRELSSGSTSATFCSYCVTVLVNHAGARLAARQDGHPNEVNGRPLVLQFNDVRNA